MFGRRRSLPGNAARARSQGLAPRQSRDASTRCPGRPGSEPPSDSRGMPGSGPHPRRGSARDRPPFPVTACVLSLCTSPIFTAIILSLRPPSIPRFADHYRNLLSGLSFLRPVCPYMLSSTRQPKLLSSTYQTKSLLYNTLH